MKVKLNAYSKIIIIASFVISAGLILFIALNANRHLQNMSRNNSELYSAYKISELMKSFKSNLLTLGNKQKNYLVTGDPNFLEEYKAKEGETKTYLKSMEKYFSGKPEEEIFYKLKELTYKKLMETKNLNQQNNLAGFQGKQTVELSTNSMTEILSVIEEIDKSLSKTTQVLIDNSVEYVRVSKNWGVLEVMIGVIVSLAALFLLLRDISIRNNLEKELRIAKQQADENAQLKERFMANMSHEIRTPMNAILGFTDLMQKTALDKTQLEYTTAIKSSGSNLLNIINDILDFSKIEAGKLVIEKIAFNISDLLDSLRIMFTEKAKQKNIHFEIETGSTIPKFVFGDPTRLTQILVNLVNNAIKFTETGSVKLSCQLKSIEHNSAQIVFRIKDTGIGIPPDKIDAIFERFNQGNKETTRRYGGTGLGLSIVKDLVELQNGEIRVKSKQNLGSEFIVTISYPVSFETVQAPAATDHKKLAPLSKKHLSVLLAEDNELNQKLAKTYLEGFGLLVDLAEHGLIAIDKLKEKKYDLVLMDIQMPHLDGYNTAIKIRQELNLNVPIIAMTAHIMPGEKEKCVSFGMNDYISKPFNEEQLYAVVSANLKQEAASGIHSNTFEKSNGSAKPKNVVDFNALNDMSRGNKEFLKEMIDLFLEKNPEDLSHLGTAITNTDFETVRAISHRMKTSLGFMGLQHLGEPLGEMEEMAERREKISEIKSLFARVKKECDIATIEFKEVLETN